MPQDSMGNEVMLGDWLRVPDAVYPWTADTSMIYGSQCRSVEVTHVFDDGVVEIKFHKMQDLRHLGVYARDPFAYTYQLMAYECLRIMSGEEYRGGPASETPQYWERQPRDAAGRFTSRNTTERPTSMTHEEGIIADDVNVGYNRAQSDTVMAMWASVMAANGAMTRNSILERMGNA